MTLQLQVERLTSGTSPELKLQLGCGTNLLPGWVNTDNAPVPGADYLDFTKPFPFYDEVFAAVFCEHTIEHIPKVDASHMIGEVFRILRPGGLFRIVTPSLENFCRLMLEPESDTAQKYVAFVRRFTNNPSAAMADAVNLIFYGHGHRHVFAVTELAHMLQQAGFTSTRTMPAGTYGNAVFDGVDGHGRVVGEEINAIEAFALEATKK